MSERKKSLVYIHISVFLFGFSALFARLVDQPALVITFGRVLFSSLFLLILIRAKGRSLRLDSGGDYALIIASGMILAVHWFSFIQSIQMSTVAIGTITFATFPVFTAFLEPVFFRERLRVRTVACSVIMLAGVLLISPWDGAQRPEGQVEGIFIGLLSSLTYAALALLNRRFSARYGPDVIVFYEQATAAVLLLPPMLLIRPAVTIADTALLLVLGVVFTAVAHGLFVKGIRHVKVGTAGIISGLESVYAIILASLLLREPPAIRELAGGGVVVAAAFYMTVHRNK